MALTIVQEPGTIGTIDGYLDDVLEATHTTNVPDTETGSVLFEVSPRTNAARTLDIDYVAFESQQLGVRNS
jgi:hypothetical protein